ncbi:disulfide bond formation protein DsbA [Zhengella mangrovi]|uniref:Disulfide bond formation protein DsbA n=1 Tax=Zhengella mangrovi TaxID=1982044 RepID=A0A2G1QJU7_9HYPH|nr:DsbA family protein [Zhengella mangrovi]PHP65807.1 disulfide bond formation protein DsbA [Zhengella mangrovi]
MTMTRSPTLTIDFFHDAVCGWCFNMSPRLRHLANDLDIAVRHRSFVLQDSPQRMAEVFGSLAAAKETILGHWAACRAASGAPERIDIAAMRSAGFDYPHGLPAALACKAAQALAGQAGHWNMFDAIQAAHMGQARNIADRDVLLDIAAGAGLDVAAFRLALDSPATASAVEADRRLARRLQVSSVPALIVAETGMRLANGPVEDLRAQLLANMRLVA